MASCSFHYALTLRSKRSFVRNDLYSTYGKLSLLTSK